MELKKRRVRGLGSRGDGEIERSKLLGTRGVGGEEEEGVTSSPTPEARTVGLWAMGVWARLKNTRLRSVLACVLRGEAWALFLRACVVFRELLCCVLSSGWFLKHMSLI